ncbi:hypothetical protein GCM10011609_79360 [Lentzea pudingi]|uniref:Uncharacterized protein n=1 Tax=Lentzea pudingi TaxID=1789439 RepID=A0ABQ2ISW2_9PSEU|nr:YbaB/EbfC family nucleoid-associated protein [Lentzea pudingi]GGN25206.1 hypothetical protein GCM10011609_79360 [Lentzea pudingi]
MNNPELEARNAALRGQVDTMLANLEQQTAQLRQAQAEAMAEVGRARSQDGLVEVTVNAGGLIPAPPPIVQPAPRPSGDDEPPESFMDRRGGRW